VLLKRAHRPSVSSIQEFTRIAERLKSETTFAYLKTEMTPGTTIGKSFTSSK